MVVYIYISPKDNYERVRIYAANIHITNAILKSLFHADLTKKRVKIETRIQSVIGEKMSDGSHTKKLNKIKLIFMGLSNKKNLSEENTETNMDVKMLASIRM